MLRFRARTNQDPCLDNLRKNEESKKRTWDLTARPGGLCRVQDTFPFQRGLTQEEGTSNSRSLASTGRCEHHKARYCSPSFL